MESISSEKLQIIWHTLSKIELAITRLQERTAAIKTVDELTEGTLLPTYPAIPWKRVMGMRDVIAHHYFDVDAEVVYGVITKEIAPLKAAIETFKEQLFK